MASNGGSEGIFTQVKDWVSENKLKTIGVFWGTALASSIAWNFSKPHEKMSTKLLHARIHAQGLTLGALAGAALLEYFERQKKNDVNLAHHQ